MAALAEANTVVDLYLLELHINGFAIFTTSTSKEQRGWHAEQPSHHTTGWVGASGST